jgi:phage-related protein
VEVAGWQTVGRLSGRRFVGGASSLGDRIARTFFIVVEEEIILLHGIIKKSRTAPKQELALARKRQASYMKQHRK